MLTSDSWAGSPNEVPRPLVCSQGRATPPSHHSHHDLFRLSVLHLTPSGVTLVESSMSLPVLRPKYLFCVYYADHKTTQICNMLDRYKSGSTCVLGNCILIITNYIHMKNLVYIVNGWFKMHSYNVKVSELKFHLMLHICLPMIIIY